MANFFWLLSAFTLFVALVAFIAYRRSTQGTDRAVNATCCGRTLSEWFIDKDAEGWGMKCLHCKRVSPWINHQQFRDKAIWMCREKQEAAIEVED